MDVGRISLPLLIAFVVLGVTIVIVFRILHVLILPSIERRKVKDFFANWIFRLELLTWIAFAVYFIYRFMLVSPLVTLVVLILVVAIGWKFWKDLFSGIILKLEDRIKPGDSIAFTEESGNIVEMGNRNITLKSKQGEISVIPYSNINGYKIIREQGRDNVLRFRLSKVSIKSFGGNQALKKLILSCPWSSPRHTPEIQSIDDSQVEITAWAMDSEVKDRLKEYVLRAMSQ